jgi:alkanesulfonate monooxygenase SsuD/methylene tetrahydromethanopterin reductase-like flavin-dependent oxidoreductase (luciferase family)
MVRDLGDIRLGERSSGDAARLYRDALAILDRVGAGESEDAADIAAKLAGLVASTTPASAEAAQLVERALRIRKQAASVPADATPTQDAAIEPAAPAPAADPSEARPDATEAADDDALVLDEPDTPLDPHIRPALLAEE